jgi:hypothetical protein
MGIFIVGIGCAVVAWKTGGRYYPHGDRVTSIHMRRVLEFIEMKVSDSPGEFTEKHGNPIKNLPTEAGDYDLTAAVRNGQETHMFTDGWDVPMKLKVVVTEKQKIDYLLMSAGEDRKWNTEDDFTSQKYAETWEDYKYIKRETTEPEREN